jgi:hypothetical protein
MAMVVMADLLPLPEFLPFLSHQENGQFTPHFCAMALISGQVPAHKETIINPVTMWI